MRLFLFLFLPSLGFSQTDFTAMGFTSSTGSGELNVSVGQVAYSNDSVASGDVNMGVQQTYIVGVKNIAEYEDIDVWVFPNPTSTTVRVHIPKKLVKRSVDLKYSLYDAAGRLVRQDEIISEETLIPMEFYAQGNYLLNVVEGLRILGTYTIIRS